MYNGTCFKSICQFIDFLIDFHRSCCCYKNKRKGKLGFMQVTYFKKGIQIMTQKRTVETGISTLAAFDDCVYWDERSKN